MFCIVSKRQTPNDKKTKQTIRWRISDPQKNFLPSSSLEIELPVSGSWAVGSQTERVILAEMEQKGGAIRFLPTFRFRFSDSGFEGIPGLRRNS